MHKKNSGGYLLKEETEGFSTTQNEDYILRQQIEDEIRNQLYYCGSICNSQKRILYSNIKFIIDLILEEMGEDD